MISRAPIWIPLLAIAAACSGSGASDSSSPAPGSAAGPVPGLPADSEIAALIYDSRYSVPAGFFVDERASTERSYTVHHVLDASRSYELCTDDYAVALAWEDADNASRSVQGYYVGSHETVRYFEFIRELAYEDDIGNVDDLTSPGFARVFKCSNTNRDGVDRSLLTGYAGTLNAHPLDTQAVREFAEYLWQFTFFPAARRKVIASRSDEDGNVLQHTLQLAFAIGQGTGNCDRIEVAEWRFTADPQTGTVQKSLEVVHNFEARLEHGKPALCD